MKKLDPDAKGFADLFDLQEDERITMIGEYLMNRPASSSDKPVTAALVVETQKKAKRYKAKLKKRFPRIRIIGTYNGPFEGMVTIKLGEPLR